MLKEKERSGPLAFFFLSPSNIKETTRYSPYLWSLHFIGINAPFITDALPNGSPTPGVPLGHVLFDAFDIMQTFWSSKKSMKRMYFLGRVYIKLWGGSEKRVCPTYFHLSSVLLDMCLLLPVTWTKFHPNWFLNRAFTFFTYPLCLFPFL